MIFAIETYKVTVDFKNPEIKIHYMHRVLIYSTSKLLILFVDYA